MYTGSRPLHGDSISLFALVFESNHFNLFSSPLRGFYFSILSLAPLENTGVISRFAGQTRKPGFFYYFTCSYMA